MTCTQDSAALPGGRAGAALGRTLAVAALAGAAWVGVTVFLDSQAASAAESDGPVGVSIDGSSVNDVGHDVTRSTTNDPQPSVGQNAAAAVQPATQLPPPTDPSGIGDVTAHAGSGVASVSINGLSATAGPSGATATSAGAARTSSTSTSTSTSTQSQSSLSVQGTAGGSSDPGTSAVVTQTVATAASGGATGAATAVSATASTVSTAGTAGAGASASSGAASASASVTSAAGTASAAAHATSGSVSTSAHSTSTSLGGAAGSVTAGASSSAGTVSATVGSGVSTRAGSVGATVSSPAVSSAAPSTVDPQSVVTAKRSDSVGAPTSASGSGSVGVSTPANGSASPASALAPTASGPTAAGDSVAPSDRAIVAALVQRAKLGDPSPALAAVGALQPVMPSGTATRFHEGQHPATTPMKAPSGGDAPFDAPAVPFHDDLGLAAPTGTMSTGNGGAAPGGIAWLGAAALGIVLMVQRRRLAPGSRIPEGPALVLDCSPD